MPQLQKNQCHTVTITGYSAEGLGVARIDGQVVFVHGAVRGETCRVLILKVQKHMAFAKVQQVLTPAPGRQAGAGRDNRGRLPAAGREAPAMRRGVQT